MYKVLIVEDSLSIREEISEILLLEGYKIVMAEDGKTGFKVALKEQPDLIVSDVYMPNLDGFGMFKKLQENKKTKNIPLIFLSAKGDLENIRTGMNAGAVDYLIKPIDVDELTKVVKRKLEKQRLIEENINKLVDENQFLLKEAGRMAKLGYWMYDKQTDTSSWSLAVHKIFGTDPEKGMSKSTLVLNSFEDNSKQLHTKATKNLITEGTFYDLELQLTNLENEKRWIQDIGEPIYNDKNEIIGSRGIVRDITSLKKDQEELKLSNDRYKLIGRATNDAVWDWCLTTNEIYRNKEGFQRVFGFDDTVNLDKMKMEDYVHPDDKYRVGQLLKETINNPNENNFSVDFGFLSPNGKHLYINDKGFIVRDENGKATRVIGAASNITKRNDIKLSLENAFSDLETILESTADGLVVLDTEYKVARFNKKFKELWKLPEDLLTERDGSKLLNYISEQLVYPEKMFTKAKELYKKPEATSLDIVELKDGRVFERYSQPKVSNGKHTGRVWSCRDITDRVNADKEKQQLFALIESSADLVGFGDLEGKPTFINKAGRKILGIPEDQSLSEYHFSEFFHPEDRDIVLDRFQPAFKDKERWEGDTFLMNIQTKKKYAVSMSAFVIKDNITGIPIGLGNVSMDITRRIKIKNELILAKEEAEKLSGFKDQFLANMSHEIRTPLNGILGFTKILLRSHITKKQKEQLTAIKVSSDILLVVINDILDLAKIEAGKMVLEKTEIKLPHVINSILSTFELRLQAKEQTLHTHYDENIPEWVLGDSVRINQILLNIIENAIKFSHNKGTINVNVNLLEQDDEKISIEISVTDNGIGISEENIDSIFESFTQSSSNTTRKYGGSGLGLNIVKQLIELMDGTISVKSELGSGSTFTFTLPLTKATFTDIKLSDAIPNSNKLELLSQLKELDKLKILIVDDMVINQFLAKTILEDMGFETEVAENGKVAIELLEKNNFDIVLMDLQMPEMNGWEATRHIRNKMKPSKSSIPIIALTADVTQKNAAKCIEAGMDEYVSKPINETDLLQKVTHLVSGKRDITNKKTQKLPNICNLNTLKNHLRNKPQLITEMLKMILKETPLVITQINNCLTAADWSSLHANVHKIKPTLGLMGLPKEIILAAQQIEDYATAEKHLDKIATQLIKLENALDRAYIELEEELQIMKN